MSLMFPPHLALDYLYPEASVTHTQDDGSFLDVACFTPEMAEVQKVACPLPFVNPRADDHLESCIQPYPVQAYTDDEYTLMWGFSQRDRDGGALFERLHGCYVGHWKPKRVLGVALPTEGVCVRGNSVWTRGDIAVVSNEV
jgi:hypothetical protein